MTVAYLDSERDHVPPLSSEIGDCHESLLTEFLQHSGAKASLSLLVELTLPRWFAIFPHQVLLSVRYHLIRE